MSRTPAATTASAATFSIGGNADTRDDGLEGLKGRSSAPLHCPTITQPDVVEKIIHLRQHYHFGPIKITMYLKRYHDVEISTSGVWRILKRLNMNRLPASQRYKRHTGRWKRYEKQRPGKLPELLHAKDIGPCPHPEGGYCERSRAAGIDSRCYRALVALAQHGRATRKPFKMVDPELRQSCSVDTEIAGLDLFVTADKVRRRGGRHGPSYESAVGVASMSLMTDS